jgi:LuxR family maltose regulon positive regulatory protein
MDSSLLTTNLRIPPLAQPTVHRSRLVDALERAIRDDVGKLVLLSAPAGYGKTTLLAQWARATDARVAWLPLGEEENDADHFFRSLVAGWEALQPGVIDSPLGMLLSGIAPERDAVLRAFVDVAATVSDPMVFVLDDVHLIEDPEVHEALTFLLDHLPPTLRFVLAGRADPPLPLARYRAHDALVELRGEDLQFLEDETAEFLNRRMALDLSDDETHALHAQLEGWIAGLQLASLSLRRHREAVGAPLISGRHRYIADYLNEDVLVHLPDDTQRFLVQTSILDRLCGSLCDAVTEAASGEAMLEFLERENLFLMPLDDRREWFRYHRLFADFLREALRRRYPEEISALHRRAAAWFLDHDLPDPAFRHAVAGDAPELAVPILERYESEKLHGGELRVLQTWLDAIPPAWHATYPQLGLVTAGVLAFAGELDACVRCIDDVEQRLAACDDRPRQQAKVTAFRCFVACFQSDLEQAERHAAEALRTLREEDRAYRADIYHALGDTYRGHGRWEEAREHYFKVLAFTQEPGDSLRAAHVYGALADLELRRGRMRDAEGFWRRALAAVEEPANWGRLPLPVVGWVYLRLGELLYERDNRQEAAAYVAKGLEYAELGGDVRTLIAGHVLASRITLTEGDLQAAADHLERARPLVDRASFPEWTSRFERGQVELWLAQDRLRAAVAWADAAQREGAFARRPEGETAQLALARVLLVKGDGPSRERALALLGGVVRAAEEAGRAGILIEALALRAMGLWQARDRAGAMVALERALRLAEPEGYVRLFADFGLPMARLLQEARSRQVLPDYVDRLLAVHGAELPSVRDDSLPDPLSQRELEVLGLIAAGLTNREIATALFISPETVKKHSGGIYAKLDVGNRTAAVARARNLGILDAPR